MNAIKEMQDSTRMVGGDASAMFRSRDRVIYIALACYFAIAGGLMSLLLGSPSFIDGGMAFGTFIPLLALGSLITFQIVVRPRCSPLAFSLVFAGLLISAFIALIVTAAASAAV